METKTRLIATTSITISLLWLIAALVVAALLGISGTLLSVYTGLCFAILLLGIERVGKRFGWERIRASLPEKMKATPAKVIIILVGMALWFTGSILIMAYLPPKESDLYIGLGLWVLLLLLTIAYIEKKWSH